ncbi:unnamed protein product [Notodromas monacha]|uniref:Uncharacterized protein n=1 Tax=Notodromas monacha TaxID=399045 RepID=A0A7R9GC36_9CRUS|nr:unnamed protein product [Notodromas monacha]CAG0915684.1 unnamed protein product [Notodromas monacha]
MFWEESSSEFSGGGSTELSLEARYARTKAVLEKYVSDDKFRKCRNAAVLEEVRRLREELENWNFYPKKDGLEQISKVSPTCVNSGTSTDDFPALVDAGAQTQQSNWLECDDRLVEEECFPITRRESIFSSAVVVPSDAPTQNENIGFHQVPDLNPAVPNLESEVRTDEDVHDVDMHEVDEVETIIAVDIGAGKNQPESHMITPPTNENTIHTENSQHKAPVVIDSSTGDDDSFFEEGAKSVNAAYLKLLGAGMKRQKADDVDSLDDDLERRVSAEVVQKSSTGSMPKLGSILKKMGQESDDEFVVEGGKASDDDDDFY